MFFLPHVLYAFKTDPKVLPSELSSLGFDLQGPRFFHDRSEMNIDSWNWFCWYFWGRFPLPSHVAHSLPLCCWICFVYQWWPPMLPQHSAISLALGRCDCVFVLLDDLSLWWVCYQFQYLSCYPLKQVWEMKMHQLYTFILFIPVFIWTLNSIHAACPQYWWPCSVILSTCEKKRPLCLHGYISGTHKIFPF